MKRFYHLFALLLLVTGTAITASAQATLSKGEQVTSSTFVEGKLYLLYYNGNNNSGFVKAKDGYFQANYNDETPTEESLFYFIEDLENSGTYKIKSFYKGTYFPIPTKSTTFTPTDETNAGVWALNFQNNNNIAPSCNGYSINRSTITNTETRFIHGWDSGTAAANQLKIYEIAKSSTALTEFTNKDISVDATAATDIEENKWYCLSQRTRSSYVFEDLSENKLKHTKTAPSGYAPDYANYLVRFISDNNGKHYIQTGYGNYFYTLRDGNAGITGKNNGTTEGSYNIASYTIGKIANTDGHFYLQDCNGIIMDGDDPKTGTANVAGWSTTIPTVINSNNDWAIYPAIFTDIDPTISIKPSNVTVIQGNQTTGKGNTMQALLRAKVELFKDGTPTAVNITLNGASNIDKVAVYTTSIDEIYAEGANPQYLGEAEVLADGEVVINTLNATTLTKGTIVYLWITADIKVTATEWATIDASLNSISTSNAYGSNTCDLSSIGNPDGEMRIYKQQQFLWTSSLSNTKYYRIPTILNTKDGGIIALTDYRHDHPYDLGKTANNVAGPHVIDVVVRKYKNGTWDTSKTIASGDGTNAASYGYGDPAIVSDADGTLHCLMAAGNSSYANSMLHMGYTKSTDNGTTWSEPTDIYSAIDKGGLNIASAFTTGGKGVTFSNGRIAFAFLGKIGRTTNIYPLYSDDKGNTWHISPNVAYSGGDESKLEIMNDNSLLVSVRKGSYNGMDYRGYNRTTGDASGDGIANWGTQGVWGDEMNANGCNADILYYNRAIEDASRPDVIFHTLTKTYSTYRKDLRLYMSFDEGETWKEAFQLQPGYAAYSSMQKLANGDLAIIFEDGSIGNVDKQDCYAINYVVISKETIEAKIDELYTATHHSTANIIDMGVTDSSAPYGTWSPTSGWANKFTTNTTSGMAGIEISATYNAFNRQGGYDQRVFCIKPSAAGAQNDVITITAPGGFVIDSYSIGGYYGTESETYTLTAENGSSVAINKKKADQNPPSYLEVTGINKKETTITMSNNNSKNSNFAYITHFTVTISSTSDITLHEINGSSYATLYMPYAVTLGDDVKGYTVTVDTEKSLALLTEVGQTLPAYTPVVLQSASGKTSSTAAYCSNAESVTVGDNVLKGILYDSFVSGYVLNAIENVPGFYRLDNGGTLGANRAYLPADMASSVKGYAFVMNDETGIETMHNSKCIQNNAVYDLTGRKIMGSSPKKGLYIIKGKKVLIR